VAENRQYPPGPTSTGGRQFSEGVAMRGPYGIVGLVVAVILILLLLRLLGLF
jgi:hypothetical protein